MTPSIPEPRYVVGVRALCEFTARRGDLDLRFTPAPSAQEGVAGHGIVAARRAPGYQAELSLAGDYRGLTVRGRADGYDAAANLLEEVKTHRGPLENVPANHRHLHRAQARVYGALLCRQLDLARLRVAIVYFDIATQQETSDVEEHTAEALQGFFEAQCDAFLHWSAQEMAHARARDAALAALPFPHAAFRAGQRQLSEGVYRAAVNQRCLVAQAPTGIGKTIGTIFPLLKAWPGQRYDKLLFLTAKGSGRGLALDALARLRGAAPGLRVVELVARDKACEHPDKACHGDSCPLARGFHDRLPAARQAALDDGGALDGPALRSVALAHGVCPYYLGQELVRWADVVVADYNHWFDLNAILHGLALADEWQVAVLVDEAHNLLERARRMYTAELDRTTLKALRRTAPAAVAPALARLDRCWSALQRAQAEPYVAYEAVPARLATTLRQASTALADHCAEMPAGADPALLDFHFAVLHFLKLLELFGPHTLFDITRAAPRPGAGAGRNDSVLCLRNVIPAPHLQRRFATARTTVLFSATLTPLHFHRATLGLPADTLALDVAAPFAPGQLTLHVARHVSTRYRHREASLGPIAELMARQFAARPGNYLAFFSSFDYLERAASHFAARHPAVPIWTQSRAMPAAARDAFLARFTEAGRGIGFAVLGGSFGEAIDLPGARLIGAFVATLGLPPSDPVNEQMRERIEATLGNGYDCTYLYPGIQKVVQAVGRVIRSASDIGIVHLIDDRYDRPEVRRLFPRWWQLEPAARGGPPKRAIAPANACVGPAA